VDDLATLTAQPKPLNIGGKTYQVHPLTLNDLGAFQAWIDTQFPDPLEIASKKMATFPVAAQKHLIAVAMEQAAKGRRLLGTPDADAVAQSIEGVSQLLFLSIRKGDPSFTEADARALFNHLNAGDISRVFGAAGVMASTDEADDDPK